MHRKVDPVTARLQPSRIERTGAVLCLCTPARRTLVREAIDVLLEEPDGQRVIELREPGDTSVVPRGVWHRAIIREPSHRIFLVAGNGTKMRPAD